MSESVNQFHSTDLFKNPDSINEQRPTDNQFEMFFGGAKINKDNFNWKGVSDSK